MMETSKKNKFNNFEPLSLPLLPLLPLFIFLTIGCDQQLTPKPETAQLIAEKTIRENANVTATETTTTEIVNIPTLPQTLMFGQLKLGQESPLYSIIFSNNSQQTLTNCTGPTFSGTSAADFHIKESNCTNLTQLAPGNSCYTLVYANLKSTETTHKAALALKCKQATITTQEDGLFAYVASEQSTLPLGIFPEGADFGKIYQGAKSSLKSFTITNITEEDLINCTAPQLFGSGAKVFSIIENTCDQGNLPRDSSCAVLIEAAPQLNRDLGLAKAGLKISCNQKTLKTQDNGLSVTSIAVSSGQTAVLTTPSAMTFPQMELFQVGDAQAITFTNMTGKSLLNCTPPSLTGDTQNFEIISQTCNNPSMLAGTSCQTVIRPIAGSQTGVKSVTAAISCGETIISTEQSGIRVSVQDPEVPLNLNLSTYPSELNYGTITAEKPGVFSFLMMNNWPIIFKNCQDPGLSGADAGDFKIVGHTCAATMNPGSFCRVTVQSSLKTTFDGLRKATLSRKCDQNITISSAQAGLVYHYAPTSNETPKNNSNNSNNNKVVYDTIPKSLYMGSVQSGEKSNHYTVLFFNSGISDATQCTPANLVGTHAAEFSIVQSTCQGSSLGSGQSCYLEIAGIPNSAPATGEIKTVTIEKSCANTAFSSLPGGISYQALPTVTITPPPTTPNQNPNNAPSQEACIGNITGSSDFNPLYWITISGQYTFQQTMTSLANCRQLCRQNTTCQAFTYMGDDSKMNALCSLKNSSDVQSSQTLCNAYSEIKISSHNNTPTPQPPQTPQPPVVVVPPLTVKSTISYERVWDDAGSGADEDITISLPKAEGNYFPIDQRLGSDYNSKPHYETILVSGNTVAPIGAVRIWTDKGSGADKDVSIWRPSAPAGYTCLSDIAVKGYPSALSFTELQKIRCLPTSCVTMISSQQLTQIWKDTGSGADQDVAFWAANFGAGLGFRAIADKNKLPTAGVYALNASCY